VPSPGGPNAGAIAGGVVGGVVGLVLILALLFFYSRRRRRPREAMSSADDSYSPTAAKEGFQASTVADNSYPGPDRPTSAEEAEPARLYPLVGLGTRERQLDGDRMDESARYSNY
jgi:LPXTG-motif cell wall-anchored protein